MSISSSMLIPSPMSIQVPCFPQLGKYGNCEIPAKLSSLSLSRLLILPLSRLLILSVSRSLIFAGLKEGKEEP
ncbi:MAG TPA: hypothetical protein VJ767_02390 [Nitrososphaeraceae archaeon]|nr:hypothetical protein [Nitrososphaeraceae archaeon]